MDPELVRALIADGRKNLDLLEAAIFPPEPPPPPPPSETVVTSAAALTAALEVGGRIRLAGGTYVGNFVIGKDGTELVGVLGLSDRRVTPEEVASALLAPANVYAPTLIVAANDVQVDGLTVYLGNYDREAVVVGNLQATEAATQPHRVELRRLAVIAPEGTGRRGIALHGEDLNVRWCHVAGFCYSGRDSQAVWINNGPGPYAIVDNFLEASGENVMAGGAEIYIPNCVPSDILIAGNHLHKPEAWRTRSGSVKNLLELKAGRRVLIEGNLLDGNWKDAQAGDSIVLTPRNPSGRNPWIVVEDVTIRSNVVRRARDGYVLSILGTDNNQPTQQTRRITVEHNLFEDARGGLKILGGVAESLAVRRNTFPAIGGNWFLFANIDVLTPIDVRRNVAKSGAYGISGSTTVGEPSLLAACQVQAFSENVIEKYASRTIRWPSGNTLLEPGTLAGLLDAEFRFLPDATLGY